MTHRVLQYSLATAILMSCHHNQNDTIQHNSIEKDMYFAVGTYTKKEGHVDGKAPGIYIAKLNEAELSIIVIDSLTGITNPSYVTIDDRGRKLYSVSETGDNLRSGMIKGYQYDAEWNFQELNEASTHCNAPCHLALSSDQDYIMTANYMGGISAHKIMENGSIGPLTDTVFHMGFDPDSGRQSASHPHMILQTPVDNQVLISDLGSNKIFHYEVKDGMYQLLASTLTLPNTGPRHAAHHPHKKYVYVLNELNNTVEVFSYADLTQEMDRKQSISTLSENTEAAGMSASAIKIHSSGKFLYTANRGNDQNFISAFKINDTNGTLTIIQNIDSEGEIPRDFEISPSGKLMLVANQNSDNIVLFKIDQNSGTLSKTDKSFHVLTPVCIKFFQP